MSSYTFRKTKHGFSGSRVPTWAAAIGAIGVLVAAIGAWSWLAATEHAPAIPLAMLGVGAASVIVATTLGRRAIAIDDRGIRSELSRGEWLQIRWDEPHAFRSQETALTRGSRVAYVKVVARIDTPDGRSVELHETSRPGITDTAIEFAARSSARHNLETLRRAWVAGEELVFGPVRLCGRRVTVGAHAIEAVGPDATITLRNGELFVGRATTATPTGIRGIDVPNLRCLLALVA